jgi:ssDNA-binding Zn-finger/Zn-ribbon topoisomerase 1
MSKWNLKITDEYSIGHICDVCGADSWIFIDNPKEYIQICANCFNKNDVLTQRIYNKQSFVDNFECPDCGALVGTLEENKKKLGVRCSVCNKLTIMLEKHESAHDNRHLANKNTPKCPKCGSTAITTGARGVNGLLGFIGAGKTVNRCSNCGNMWRPRK